MIQQKLKSIFLKDPAKPWFWIVLGILVKGLPLLFLLHNYPPSDIPGFWGATMTDTHTYLAPIDNLLRNGTYSPDYRMPGYGFVYLVFRFVFSQAIACNLLLIFQFILGGISVYYLALIAKKVFNCTPIFYVTYFIFLFSTYSNFYDGWLLTESFCTSALIFAIWFFVNYFEKEEKKHLIFSGLFLTWVIFLRPVFAPIYLILLVILIFKRRSQTPKGALSSTIQSPFRGLGQKILLLILPFLICDGIWVTRNYQKHNELIFLTSAKLAPRAEYIYEPALSNFIRSWGGSADFTDNKTPLLWFGFHLDGMPDPKDYKDSLPDYIYTSKFNKDSLIEIKVLISMINYVASSGNVNLVYQKALKARLDRYTQSIKEEKPFLYYIQAPFFHCLPRFLFGPEVKYYTKRFQLPGIVGYLSEIGFTIFYYLVLGFGLLGSLLLFCRGLKYNSLILLISIIPLYTIAIHALILRVTSNRFLMPCWPFILVCAAYLLISIFERKKAK